MFKQNKNNINLLIFFSGSIIFLFKWYLSFANFDEDISVKIIFESVSDGYYYFPELKLLTDFNLSNSFDPFVENLKNITIPTGAFALHFIFYLIFNELSFIILEFFFIVLFLIIFYKISRILGLERIQSVAVAIILFNLPNLLQILNIHKVEYIRVLFSNFYSFRFPRPLVSNIFFYAFILFILRVNKKKIFTKKNSLILGSISGFTFTAFYHFFILEQLFIVFSLLCIFKLKILSEIKKNIKFIYLYLLSFFIISSPTLINMFFSEVDYLERLGFTVLDINQKIILLKYLFFKLFKIQFLLTFFITTFLFVVINYNKKFFEFKKLNPFFILFYLSIISPFIFITVSPTYFSMGHLFNNIILICTFLLFFFGTFLLTDYFFKKNLFFKLSKYISFFLIIACLFVNFFQTNLNYSNNHLNKDNLLKRKEFNSIVEILKNINIFETENITLLTFDNQFLTWSILNNIKYLNIVNGTFFSKKHDMIENDLINTFKYLNLSKNDFKEFIKNKKKSEWRYRNENIKNFFWMKYQANSLITHNKSKNFDKNILEFINESSPLLSQQLIMPKEEIKRFLDKFDAKMNIPFSNPEIIIINKDNSTLIKSNINLSNFCKSFEGKFYDFYYSFKLHSKCIN